ncbi:clathrin adaptor complex small chain family protein [Cryptosporidium andersoni]|uniref:AP complex subunit sigma n=1 Tax=Cryptosporidium andersoni TaxID=117008 RepID=A0A1J4MT62_9CRYT|nr:clathrin adaptor complex small chain family protein [Cryptosporidium andersoni]
MPPFNYINKQGQTRLSQYYEYLTIEQRTILEGQLIRKCLSIGENHSPFIEFDNYKIIFRRYASLYFILGIYNCESVNELAYLELIHFIVETLDKYFENVCELDIMFNLDKAHIIIDEIIMNGLIAETNKANVMQYMNLIEKAASAPKDNITSMNLDIRK